MIPINLEIGPHNAIHVLLYAHLGTTADMPETSNILLQEILERQLIRCRCKKTESRAYCDVLVTTGSRCVDGMLGELLQGRRLHILHGVSNSFNHHNHVIFMTEVVGANERWITWVSRFQLEVTSGLRVLKGCKKGKVAVLTVLERIGWWKKRARLVSVRQGLCAAACLLPRQIHSWER